MRSVRPLDTPAALRLALPTKGGNTPLPILHSLLARTPSSIWAAALGALRLWLQEVFSVVPPGGCTTPPLPCGWGTSGCFATKAVHHIGPPPLCPPHYRLPLMYTRRPTGTWVLGLPAPAAALVAALVGPSCARPYPHTAAVISHVAQMTLPCAFCFHHKCAPTIMTADVMDKCITHLPGLPCPMGAPLCTPTPRPR